VGWIVCTRDRLVFEEPKGVATVLYMPSYDQQRQFNDLTIISPRAVQERFGDTTQPLLWRNTNGMVSVFGILRNELRVRRQAVEVFLPHDFTPLGTDALYFVVSPTVVVHAVRYVSDDGHEDWRCSVLQPKKQELVEFLETIIAERFLQRGNEQVCFAVLGQENLRQTFAKRLESYGIQPLDMAVLSRRRGIKALYSHADYTLLLLGGILALLLLAVVIGSLLLLSTLRAQNLRGEVTKIEEQIRRVQQDSPLRNLEDPHQVLQTLQPPLPVPPADVLHAAGELASQYGTIQQIVLTNLPSIDATTAPVFELPVEVTMSEFSNDLLLDQEELGQLALRERPWVRQVSRQVDKNTLDLVLQVQEPQS